MPKPLPRALREVNLFLLPAEKLAWRGLQNWERKYVPESQMI